eukprot:13056068-Alexandrium_andersonii.AAC.1
MQAQTALEQLRDLGLCCSSNLAKRLWRGRWPASSADPVCARATAQSPPFGSFGDQCLRPVSGPAQL